MTARFLQTFLTTLLLSFILIVGEGTAHAATNDSQTTLRPDVVADIPLNCNYRLYSLNPNLQLVKSSGNEVVALVASNLNGSPSVQISRNGTYNGEYDLPATFFGEIYVDYSSQQSSYYVAACTDWTQGQS